MREAQKEDQQLWVLAGGSNVVVADEGLPGVVMRVATQRIEETRTSDGVRLDVAAGHNWDSFVVWCVSRGYAGIEALSGIPGSVGATPIQNVGAYGQAVADAIAEVRVLDRVSGDVYVMDRDVCRFGYRTSIFKDQPKRWIVLSVRFILQADTSTTFLRSPEVAKRLKLTDVDPAPLADIREAVLAVRRGKGMLLDDADPDSVSVGSFFLNPVLGERAFLKLRRRVEAHCGEGVEPHASIESDGSIKVQAWWLILGFVEAGFERGYGNPEGIALSTKHALVLTNRGSGTTAAVIRLAQAIAATVYERFGVVLKPEPVFLGVDWRPIC